MLGPVIQFECRHSVLILEALGRRWKWEKTKVWRFLRKYQDTFKLHRLPGSYGCLIYNSKYPTGTETFQPSQEDVVRILRVLTMSAYPKWQQTFYGKMKSFLSAGKKCAYIAPRKAALHFFPL